MIGVNKGSETVYAVLSFNLVFCFQGSKCRDIFN